jgi:hypothetical protein
VNAPRGASQRHRSLESRLEIERLTSGLEGGCWKSAQFNRVARWQPTLQQARFLGEGDGSNAIPLPGIYTLQIHAAKESRTSPKFL